ncbi:MAG: sensor histidine kinase [Kofleriaceae bacterium]
MDRHRKQVRLPTDNALFRVIQKRMLRVQSISAGIIVALIIGSTWGNWVQFAIAIAIHAVLYPFNLAFDRIVIPRAGYHAEVYRAVANHGLAAVCFQWIDWPLACWLWLPFAALAIDESAGRRGLLAVLTCCAISAVSGIAYGVPVAIPFLATVFAMICYAFVTARGEIIREMLRDAERQRDELARTEMELRQAQKLEAIGRLAAGVAHEINTPMQFVSDNLKFVTESAGELLALANECATPEKAEAVDLSYLHENMPVALEHARVGVQRVASIVRSMKEFAHPGGTEAGPVDLNAAIMNTLTISHYEYKLVADIETKLGELPTFQGNGGELNQVLLNLIINAAHAISDVVARRTMDRGRISITSHVEDGDIVIEISDTGAGIKDSIRMKVFEPFFTTKPVGRGTGQGLAISRAVIERHGGTLDFTSVVGKGTTFSIRLPITRDARSVPNAA